MRLKKEKKELIALLVIYGLFFGALLLTGEPMYLGDSYQHENQFVSREPIYALIIQALKLIIPEAYLNVLIIIQNLLAIISYTAFTKFFRDEYKLPTWSYAFIVAILLSPHIITPLASSTNMVITNSIMTEGITYSLFLLFLIPTLRMINEEALWSKNTVQSLVAALFISLVRGQLMTLLVVWLIAVFIKAIIKKNYKKILCFVLMFILSFSFRTVFVKTYNYAENGLFVSTVSGKSMQVANVIYISDLEDANYIEDVKLRDLFILAYEDAENNGYNYKYAPDGFIAKELHYEACHEAINFDCFFVRAKEYLAKENNTTVSEYQVQYQKMLVEIDDLAAAIQSEVLPHILGRYLNNYLRVVTVGLIRSVAFVNKYLNIYSIVAYMLAIILMINCLKNNRASKAGKLCFIALLMILGNVTATSLMLQCISRYMMYQLPIFYISIGTAIIEIYRNKVKQNGI